MTTQQSIPLQYAAIGWTPANVAFPFKHPRIIIIDSRTHIIPEPFIKTNGAVWSWWTNPRTPQYKRLLELLWMRGEMLADGLPYNDILNAFDVIPEFNQWFNSSNESASDAVVTSLN